MMERILIAEDESNLRRGITLSLKTSGYDVVETDNGADALQAIVRTKGRGNPFSLLICDIQMPKMTGEELLEKLKNMKISLPTLVITGYGEKKLIVRLMRAGCRDFIDKPFEPDFLCKQVSALLSDPRDSSLEARRRERMAAIGEKAVQTAHDLNNMLTGIIGNADMTLGKIAADHPMRRTVEKLLVCSNRAAEICKGLLTDHRKTENSILLTTEINSVVARVGAILKDIVPDNIDVSAETLDRPAWLKGDAERLQQALLNLGFNAIAAMPKGGTISIETKLSRPPDDSLARSLMEIIVRDTGVGMSDDMLKSLFNKGYSMRPESFGLGLCIVRKIVEEHDGRITIKSKIGEGTSFSLFFPIT